MSAPMKSHVESPEIRKILNEHASLHLTNDNTKVKCDFSGHEMPCRVEVLQTYVNGKKYLKLREAAAFCYDKQHLVPSSKHHQRHQLFCKLTLRHLNNTPAHIERHVTGRRYKKALARWNECKRTGTKFVPRAGRDSATSDGPKKPKEGWESESDVESNEEDMADLYPDLDSDNSSEEEDKPDERLIKPAGDTEMSEEEEDFDFEDMDAAGSVDNITDQGKSLSSDSGHTNSSKTKGKKNKDSKKRSNSEDKIKKVTKKIKRT